MGYGDWVTEGITSYRAGSGSVHYHVRKASRVDGQVTYARNGETILYMVLEKVLYRFLKSVLLFYLKLVQELEGKGFELIP